MSEFYEDVLDSVAIPDESTIEEMVDQNTQTIQERTQDYYAQ